MAIPTIEVNVWYPAAYNGITDEQAWEQVYRTCKEFKAQAVGHVSLFVRAPYGDSCYLSFWPKESDINGLLKSQKAIDLATLAQSAILIGGDFKKNIQEDSSGMGYIPNRTISLDSLFHTRIYDAATKLKRETKNYNLFFQNCSSVVAYALASGVLTKDLKGDVKTYYSRCKEIFNTVAVGVEVYSSLRTGYMPDLKKAMSKEFALMKTLLSIPEVTLGTRTPKMVEEYADRLNDLGIKALVD